MSIKNQSKRAASLVLTLALIFSVFAGLIPTSLVQRASAADASSYPTGVIYTASARVDESIGLRASASIGSAEGISPLETRLIRPNATMDATNSSTLQVTINKFDKYTLDKAVVAAIATITHSDKTKEAVKDIYTITGSAGASFTYTVPDFSAYVESGDSIDVEIVLYADLSYDITLADCITTINVNTGAISDNQGGAITSSGSTIMIDASAVTGPIEITGTAVQSRQVMVYNSSRTNTSNRRVDIVLNDARIILGAVATATNYTDLSTNGNFGSLYYGGSSGTNLRRTMPLNSGTFTRWTTNTASVSGSTYYYNASALHIADADVYLTTTGTTADSLGNYNVLANIGYSNSMYYLGQGIHVDASASLVVTDASDKNLYTRGGTCGSAIGSQGDMPSGFMEFDGGDTTAYAASNNHHYAGIGNGGHYNANDPGIRGYVQNGGKVNALGFHYGIGGNGGGGSTAATISDATGPAYIVVTGGSTTTESSAAAGGAALGFAHNNAQHTIRIGRPDKDDSAYSSATKTGLSVLAVNWGFGAGISGDSTFYSGVTEAYSGQYSAAIGGNAVSYATTGNAMVAHATGTGAAPQNTAVAGTPLTVYGGNVTAVAGAFTTADTYGYANGISHIRGASDGSRPSAASAATQTRPSDSYGSAIGGAIRMDGGSQNNIFAGTFHVESSVYGAGIGGGGGYTSQNGGGGGTTWIGSLTNLSDGSIEPMNFTIVSGTYGAGIGGGGSASGAAGSAGNLYIAGDTQSANFNVYSGEYGAGIGGGGSDTGVGGGGGTEVIVSGGRFNIQTGLDSYTGVDSNGKLTGATYSDPSYGAGIGGGGSGGGNAGNGPTKFLATGGYFTSTSYGYGAGIGGGGSNTGTAGTGGQAQYNGGTVVVSVPGDAMNSVSTSYGSVGMGGGSASNPNNSRTDEGEVVITGGNIYTLIDSKLNNISGNTSAAIQPDWSAWTMPYPKDIFGILGNGLTGATATTGTGSPVQFTLNASAGDIGLSVYRTYYNYNGWYYNYGVNDMYVTENPDTGAAEVWIWVPSGYHVNYDMTSGYASGNGGGTLRNGTTNDFDISDAERSASGNTKIELNLSGGGTREYQQQGETKTLISYDTELVSGASSAFDGVQWSSSKNYTTPVSASEPMILSYALEHQQVNGIDVAFVGWTSSTKLSGLADSDTATSFAGQHIFDVSDGWNISNYEISNVTFTENDITVYAMWGFDRDGDGIADVLRSSAIFAYDGNSNTGGTVPVGSNSYNSGDTAAVSPAGSLTKTGYVFVGWTEAPATIPSSWDLATFNAAYGTSSSSATDTLYISGAMNSTTGSLTFSGTTITGDSKYTITAGTNTLYALWAEDVNINGIPDFLETKYKLIHDTSGYATISIPDKEYVTNQFGETAVGGSSGYDLSTNNNANLMFIGWTANSGAVRLLTSMHTTANEAADLADPLTLTTAFSSSHITVYAVWAEDANSNGIADYKESGLSLIFDKNTTDTVTGIPVDTTAYYLGDSVDSSAAGLLAKASSNMDPYMERNGWVILGWTDDSTKIANNTSDPGYTYLDLTSLTALQFATFTDNIKIYAVWGVDCNNNGIADWLDSDGRTVVYRQGNLPIGTSVVSGTMPFASSSNTDSGPSNPSGTFTNYTSDETVGLSSQVPEASDWVFLGWSPLTVYGPYYADSSSGYSVIDYYKHLALLSEIKTGDNYTGINTANGVFTYAQDAVFDLYDIDGNLADELYEDFVEYLTTNYSSPYATADINASLLATYSQINWSSLFYANNSSSTYAQPGFLQNVTFDAFGQNMDNISDPGYSETWYLYAMWAEDSNNNGIPDMFEGGYTLYYKADVDNPSHYPATGQPAAVIGKYPGNTVSLNSGTTLYKQDSTGYPMTFLGWTLDSDVQEYYGAGEFNDIPAIASAVTFGNYDLTVYAVWAIDLDQDGTPDPLQNGFTLTYDANGGSGAPVDNTIYQYNDTVTIDTSTTPTNGSYIFLYWTEKSNLAAVYRQGDRADLPPEITNNEVTFTTKNITVYAVWGEDANGNQIADVYEDPYYLIYNANGGTGVPTDSTAYMWNDSPTLDNGAGMSYEDYIFVGWTETNRLNFSSVYTIGEAALLPTMTNSVTFTSGDITVYAVWSTDINNNGIPDVDEPFGYLFFDLDGGTSSTGAFDTQTLFSGEQIYLPAEEPTPPSGMVFVNWEDDNGNYYDTGDSFTMPTLGDATLTAQYTGASTTTYTVTYDVNGGSGTMAADTLPAGSSYTVQQNGFTAPTTNEQFAEWNTAANGSGTSFDPGVSFTLTADVTLYAIWEAIPVDTTYTVTYDANGGSGTIPIDLNDYSSGERVILASGSTIISPSSDKIFAGWALDDAGTGIIYNPGAAYEITRDVTFYAVWVDESTVTEYYTVTYDANNSIGNQYDVNVIVGTSHTVLNNSDTNLGFTHPSGYAFAGWSTSRNATSADIFAGDTIGNSIQADEVITLYAVWIDSGDEVYYTVTYAANGGRGSYSVQVEAGTYHTVLTRAAAEISRSNYTFTEWNTNANGRGMSYDPGDRILVNGNITLYAQWDYNDDSDSDSGKISFGGIGDSGSGSTTTYFSGVKSTGSISTVLDTVNHFAYITGYPDGTVRPANNITRAEVATIFFRLLTDDYRQQYWSKTNSFNDVNESNWYNNAISTLSNAKLLSGYTDGSFKPGNSITRAEFASMAVKIAKAAGITSGSGTASFNDISGHWAEADIKLAAELGYIKGDGSGTFRPDAYITRAEVMTLINRMLSRQVESEEDLLSNMTTWADNTPDKWYYFDVQEATNSHYSIRKYDDVNEVWSTLRSDPDWTKLQGTDAVWVAMTK